MDVGSFDLNQYKYLCHFLFSISLFYLLFLLRELIFNLIGKISEKF